MTNRSSYSTTPMNPRASCLSGMGGRSVWRHKNQRLRYARYQRDLFGLEAFRVTAAIPFFMVMANNVFDGVREVDPFEDVPADRGVNLHLCEFRLCQLAGFVEDVLRNSQLADVMQQGAGY